MKRLLPFLVLAIVVAAAGGWWRHRHPEAESGLLTLYGNVDIRTVPLSFRVGGRISELRFEEGDAVRKGDPVARLDSDLLAQDLAQAGAGVELAQAELRRLESGSRPQEIQQVRALIEEREAALRAAQAEFERNQQLVEKGSISRQAFDDTQSRRDQNAAQLKRFREQLALALEGFRAEEIAAGKARLAAAKVELERARTRLADATLAAPADGVLLTRTIEPGAVVQAGQTVAVLSLRQPVWIRAYVGERDLGRIRPGMQVKILTDARPGMPYSGQIGFISPEAEFTPKSVETPELRTRLVYQIRVVAADSDGGLRQGMPATVIIDLAPARP